MNKHVAVILGGKNSEREVSLASGEAIGQILEEEAYQVSYIDPQKQDLFVALKSLKPDVVFNALHGKFGEDGTLPALLDYLQIPYTHSGLTASALAFDKDLAKRIAASLGIKMPKSEVYHKGENISQKQQEIMRKPFVIKPLADGSSCDMQIIFKPEEFSPATLANLRQDSYLLEEYIAGREISIVVIRDKSIGAIEVVSNSAFYDYHAKYEAEDTQYILAPENIAPELLADLGAKTEELHKILGCVSLSRSDFIFANDQFYFLELNTHPGLTSHSLVPKLAAKQDISLRDLTLTLLEDAHYNLTS